LRRWMERSASWRKLWPMATFTPKIRRGLRN
jgi:hypothetical protein